MKIIPFSFLSLFLLGSCVVIHSGGTSSGPLMSVHDQYVDIAEGKAKSIFIFGLGSLRNDKLVLNAKKDMYSRRHLLANEYYANFSTDIAKKYILGPFIQVSKVTVSADVLKSSNQTQDVFGDGFLKKIATPIETGIGTEGIKDNYSLINNGDSLYYSNAFGVYNLYVAAMKDKETVILISTNPECKSVLVPLSTTIFFIKHKELNGIRFGQPFSFQTRDRHSLNNETKTGTVLGLNNRLVLLEFEKSFYVVPLEKTK